jgi:hypothetical protein
MRPRTRTEPIGKRPANLGVDEMGRACRAPVIVTAFKDGAKLLWCAGQAENVIYEQCVVPRPNAFRIFAMKLIGLANTRWQQLSRRERRSS